MIGLVIDSYDSCKDHYMKQNECTKQFLHVNFHKSEKQIKLRINDNTSLINFVAH